jgi:hypothetical protein
MAEELPGKERFLKVGKSSRLTKLASWYGPTWKIFSSAKAGRLLG